MADVSSIRDKRLDTERGVWNYYEALSSVKNLPKSISTTI